MMGTWLKVKGMVATIFLLVFWSVFSEGFAAETNDVGSIKIHNVGQGNCITLEVKGKGEAASQYMLIDIGTSAYGREKKWEETHHTLPSSPESHGFSSSHHTPLSSRVASAPAVPRTIERPRMLPPSLGTGGGKVGEKILEEIREALGGVAEENAPAHVKTPVHVKTVVITHPDEDHYGWLAKLLTHVDDQVDNIILGGLPENYNLKTLKFLAKVVEKTKVFFPAVSYDPVSIQEVEKLYKKIQLLTGKRNELKEILKQKQPVALETKKRIQTLELEIERLLTNQSPFALQACTSLGNGNPIIDDRDQPVSQAFQEAFHFGESIQIYMLSVNPLNFQGRRGSIVRAYDGKEDDNKESLVMKIETRGGASVILTGDATQATINRIMDNYASNLGFLQTNVLLASHHGASTHGSNSLSWLHLTQPEYILISNGFSYGHPSPEAYENFHAPLKNTVDRHPVLVGNATEKNEGVGSKEGIQHNTISPIFSTLDSGTITVKLEEGGVKISTVKGGDVIPQITSASPEAEKEEEDEPKEVSIIEDDNGEVRFVPKKKEGESEEEAISSRKRRKK